MKVVVLPGVYVYEDKPKYDDFIGKIKNKFKCQGEVFIWEMGWHHPEINLPYKTVRDFTCSVILDFQQAIQQATSISVPEADIYLGHSAGSIIALAQNKPCVIFGSPAALAEAIELRERFSSNESDDNLIDIVSKIKRVDRPVLNIINRYDVLAYPINQSNIENYYYTGKRINPLSYFPLTAHYDYWNNDRIMKKIFESMEKWIDK